MFYFFLGSIQGRNSCTCDRALEFCHCGEGPQVGWTKFWCWAPLLSAMPPSCALLLLPLPQWSHLQAVIGYWDYQVFHQPMRCFWHFAHWRGIALHQLAPPLNSASQPPTLTGLQLLLNPTGKAIYGQGRWHKAGLSDLMGRGQIECGETHMCEPSLKMLPKI